MLGTIPIGTRLTWVLMLFVWLPLMAFRLWVPAICVAAVCIPLSGWGIVEVVRRGRIR